MIEEIDAKKYEEVSKQESCMIVVGASWCPDCRKIDPILSELGREFEGRAHIYKVSADSEIRESLGIRAIPTLIAYKNGKEVGERLVEPDAKLPIQNLLEKTLD